MLLTVRTIEPQYRREREGKRETEMRERKEKERGRREGGERGEI
jgi:hypothetical protein